MNDFETQKLILPEDDYDEDDALDAKIAIMQKRRAKRVDRGTFRGV